jgi:hypothetical protein
MRKFTEWGDSTEVCRGEAVCSKASSVTSSANLTFVAIEEALNTFVGLVTSLINIALTSLNNKEHYTCNLMLLSPFITMQS